MELYLIRHPEPIEADGQCYGRADLAVAPSVLAETAARLRAELPALVWSRALIYTSPLSRCRGLASELAAPRQPLPSADLYELDFGAWEGLRWDTVPREELDAWAHDIWSYRPGGGESAAMAAVRWRRWSRTLCDSRDDSAVAVTHAGLIRVALKCEGVLSRDNFASYQIPFGSAHRLVLERNSHRVGVDA
jgi:alpha-ribazole phosphatase